MTKTKHRKRESSSREEKTQDKGDAFCVGLYLDCQDKKKLWAEARIIACDLKNRQFKVHFKGWPDKYNLWRKEQHVAAYGQYTDAHRHGKQPARVWDGAASLFPEVDGSPSRKKRKVPKEKENVANAALEVIELDFDDEQPKPRNKKTTNITSPPRRRTTASPKATKAKPPTAKANPKAKPAPASKAEPKPQPKRKTMPKPPIVTSQSELQPSATQIPTSGSSRATSIATSGTISTSSGESESAQSTTTQETTTYKSRAQSVKEIEVRERFLLKCATLWEKQCREMLSTLQQFQCHVDDVQAQMDTLERAVTASSATTPRSQPQEQPQEETEQHQHQQEHQQQHQLE